MSNSSQPLGLQPTRLPRPWDSPGKNTGVGCHSLLQCMKVKSESEVAQSCPTLRNPMDCSLPGSSIHGILLARTLEWAPGQAASECLRGPGSRGLGTGTSVCSGRVWGGRALHAAGLGNSRGAHPSLALLPRAQVQPWDPNKSQLHPSNGSLPEEGPDPACYHRNQVLPVTQAHGLTAGAGGPGTLKSQAPRSCGKALQNRPWAPPRLSPGKNLPQQRLYT